ncbi:MAG: hypothetical protein FWF79_01170 [Defluviitaleaceae bacterium]|nr:hypothetical protein [Defluviitaleaceae bacterium]
MRYIKIRILVIIILMFIALAAFLYFFMPREREQEFRGTFVLGVRGAYCGNLYQAEKKGGVA